MSIESQIITGCTGAFPEFQFWKRLCIVFAAKGLISVVFLTEAVPKLQLLEQAQLSVLFACPCTASKSPLLWKFRMRGLKKPL
jgi:hypothetical protein